jgi:transposase-like protein
MVGFGKPSANRAAGTYVKLLVKTAKYIRPFSKYDGITGKNEEEYLVDFNSAFKVMKAAALQSIHNGMTPGDDSLRLTRF